MSINKNRGTTNAKKVRSVLKVGIVIFFRSTNKMLILLFFIIPNRIT